MNSIVSKLSEIEKAAAAVVANAQSQTADLEHETQIRRDKFDADLGQQTEEKIAAIQAELNTKVSAILKTQEDNNSDTIAALEKDYQDNHERYAQEILQRIIEV